MPEGIPVFLKEHIIISIEKVYICAIIISITIHKVIT